jgi:aminopeptidase N
MKRLLPVLAALFLFAAPAMAQRLSGTVIPEHYTLWFAPDLAKETFRGRATIRVQLQRPATTITLHAAEIEFGEVTITAGGRTQRAVATVQPASETATLAVAQQIAAGPATIEIAYTGILNDKLRGFYISRANGRKYAVTQLEATDARRAFPSFDEPAYKATFDVSVTIANGDNAISNGAPLTDRPGPEPGTHTLTYATTPKMSTYLVALIVGDFTCRSGSSDGVAIRICATPDKLPLTGFALEAAAQQLTFYNRYFGVKYPFGKLDIIAVPDFAAGAMENAGAITFRERLLLVDEARASLQLRKQVANVISHEIAHQWFGNLVTMKWWDDIWLNEGFATWIANKPVGEWRPDWNVHLEDAADTQAALGLDSLRTTRAIHMNVEAPDEINQVFDAIAYEKSAGVIRMVEAFVGAEEFRKAVASYIAKYAYSNAAGQDFWTEVARVTGRPVDRIMRSYVDHPGVPVIAVRNRCVGGNTEITLSQQRFTGTPGAPTPPSDPWTVPVCFKANDGRPRCEVFDRREQTIAAPGCDNVFANADARGYYFSEYSPETVRALAKSVNGLTAAERMSLLGDESWMMRSGRHDIGAYMDLAAALARDESAAVIGMVANRLAAIGEDIVSPGDQARYQRWIRERFGPPLAELGLPGDAGDTDERHNRRAELLTLVGVAGNDPDVQRRARELAGRYIADRSSLPGTLVAAVLRVAAVGGDAALYGQYVAQLDGLGNNPEEYYRFFNALPWFRDPALVKRTLDFALSPAVRTQDTGQLIGGLLGGPWGREAAWAFTKARWSELVAKLGTFQGIPAIVGGLGAFCSAQTAADIRQFFLKNPVPTSNRSLQQGLERIETCAALTARQSAPMTRWLATQM